MARPFDLITFDFDGVLLHNNFNDLFLEQCRDLGLRWDPERERDFVRYIHDYYGTHRAMKDIETHGREAFWATANRRFLEILQVEGAVEPMLESLITRVRESNISYHHEEGIHQLLIDLRAQGYHLAMLTNRDERIHDIGTTWGFIELFEFIGTSATVGKPKPEPDLFHHISKLFNVPPQRALHVGDNPYADVRGAQAAGWHCVLLDPDDLFPDWNVPRLLSLQELSDWLARQGQSNQA